MGIDINNELPKDGNLYLYRMSVIDEITGKITGPFYRELEIPRDGYVFSENGPGIHGVECGYDFPAFSGVPAGVEKVWQVISVQYQEAKCINHPWTKFYYSNRAWVLWTGHERSEAEDLQKDLINSARRRAQRRFAQNAGQHSIDAIRRFFG